MSTFDPFRTGPVYDRHAPRWQGELDASECTPDVLAGGGMIRPFSDREHPDDYAYRVSMACPLDMCRDGVRIRVDNLWRTAPKREVRPGRFAGLIEALVHDADGEGTTLDAFMRSVCWDMYVTGVDVLTQVTGADGATVRTRADELAAGIRPYFLRFSPLQRVDWAVGGSGALRWARYCLGTESPADEHATPSAAVTRFLTVTDRQWRLWRAEQDRTGTRRVELSGRGTHPLGRPPVVKVYFAESRKPGQGAVPLSLLTRPAMVARVAMNLKSQADADLLAAVTRWMLSGVGGEDLPDTYAPGVVWKIPSPEATLQIAQGDVAHIREKRQWLGLYLGEILRLLKFRGGMAEINANSGSGLKLAIERSDLDNELRATASQLEAAELEMMRQAVALMTGEVIAPHRAAAELGYGVTYNRDYILEPVAEMLDNIRRWVCDCGLIAGEIPEIGREMTRQLANLLMPAGTEAQRRTATQIDEADFTHRD